MQEWLQKEMLLKIAANKGYLRENCCKNGCGKIILQTWLWKSCEQIFARRLLQKWLHIMAAEKLLRKWLHTKMAAAEDGCWCRNGCKKRCCWKLLRTKDICEKIAARMVAEKLYCRHGCGKAANKYLQEKMAAYNGCGKTTAEMAAYKNGCCRRRLLMQEWLQKEMLLKMAANKGYLRENCCKNGCGKIILQTWLWKSCEQIFARKLLQKWLHIMAAEKLLRKWLHTKMAAAEDGCWCRNGCKKRCCWKLLRTKDICEKIAARMVAEKLYCRHGCGKAANKYLQENCCKNGCI